jgi:site-specific recombinase XerD
VSNQTVAALLDDWLGSLRTADRSRHTIRAYAGALRRCCAWYEHEEGRPPTPADLTPVALTGYRHDLQHRQKQATRSVNSAVAALRAFGQWLADERHLPSNPAARLKTVGRQAPPAPAGLSDREVHALLRAAGRTRHPARDYALVQLLLQTGLRIGECAALDYEDLTVGERGGSVLVRGGKGNKARTVPLNASARAALLPHAAPILDVPATAAAIATAWPRPRRGVPGTPLWRSQKGNRLSVAAIRGLLDGLVRDLAARHLLDAAASAHTLRHTFATGYLRAHPGDVIGLATLLGHRSLDTTRLYSQPAAAQLAARVEALALNAYP